MLPGAQLLTMPSTFANYKPKKLSLKTKSSSASLNHFVLQIGISSVQDETDYMTHHNHRSSRTQTENELWFNMPVSERQQRDQSYRSEQSAYQTTSHRTSVCSTSARTPTGITLPTISTISDLNKPLPLSPSDLEKRNPKPASLRGFLRRESSNQLDSGHLRPEAYQQKKRNPAGLGIEAPRYHPSYSRSMPNSPYDHTEAVNSQIPTTSTSIHFGQYPDTTQYQSHALPPQQQSTHPVWQQRAVSMNPYFETTTSPPRSRTFPEPTFSPTARDHSSSRPRPHTTWGSPTESFTDASQFHLFAEAMTGLPNDTEPLSPTGPPQLQGSLFARRNANDTIPLPLQHTQRYSPGTQPTRRPHRDDWQNFEPPPLISLRSAPNHFTPQGPYQQWQPPPQMSAVSAELEMLGLDDDRGSDDELPDYQQSQAEMAAKKRQEASARARELEARWRGTQRR